MMNNTINFFIMVKDCWLNSWDYRWTCISGGIFIMIRLFTKITSYVRDYLFEFILNTNRYNAKEKVQNSTNDLSFKLANTKFFADQKKRKYQSEKKHLWCWGKLICKPDTREHKWIIGVIPMLKEHYGDSIHK